MFKLQKFYSEGFDPEQYWDDRYAQAHIAGTSSKEYERQGFWPLLQKQLQEGGTYLDVGCGIGGWVMFLHEQGHTVHGVDTAARTIRALTEYNPDLQVKIGSATQLAFQDGSLDGVLAIGVLEYLEDEVPQALQEFHRVLKPGGFVFLEVPIANTLRQLLYIPLKRLQGVVNGWRGKQSTFANYLFERRAFVRKLEQAGFEVATVRAHELPDAASHYGLWIDFKILRGAKPYQLNALGLLVKTVANMLSPWIASTGMVVVARKKA